MKQVTKDLEFYIYQNFVIVNNFSIKENPFLEIISFVLHISNSQSCTAPP